MSAQQLPRFYPIIDAAYFSAATDPVEAIVQFARELLHGGASLVQYRNKSGDGRAMVSQGRELRRAVQGRAKLMMNDRADLCLAAGFDGVHLGQDDLSPSAARRIFQQAGRPDLWIGFSTHNLDQLREAEQIPLNYIAVGPVFATRTKANPEPVIGLAGVRQAREITSKPLVAIGGITRRNCKSVLEAGADAVAVISDVVESPRKATEEFLRILG
ncbi:MAG TPA: thiamine phosphate synthase [Candidatus Angelobacter sp.]